ncbi:MAG: phosphatase PAP2 family protein [Bacteroidales bacterium]|nr:phosphatase PAP2 family protein [Bacteroidales bacterium]
MLTTLKSLDQSFFIFLNGLHSPFFDVVFFYGTMPLVWLPLYLFVFCLVIRKYKWQTLWILLFAAIMIVLSDQVANIFKQWIARPRPTHDAMVTGIHTVNGYVGGQFGFYSGHASTTMALAVYLIILLKNPYRFILPLMIFWALFMSYTRIYLGVHYPGDILVGMIMGSLIGTIIVRLTILWLNRAFTKV